MERNLYGPTFIPNFIFIPQPVVLYYNGYVNCKKNIIFLCAFFLTSIRSSSSFVKHTHAPKSKQKKNLSLRIWNKFLVLLLLLLHIRFFHSMRNPSIREQLRIQWFDGTATHSRSREFTPIRFIVGNVKKCRHYVSSRLVVP